MEISILIMILLQARRQKLYIYIPPLIEGRTSVFTTADGIRSENASCTTYPIKLDTESVIDSNPELGNLANYGGKVNTVSISSSSPAKDTGIYLRGVNRETGNLYPEANLYYSSDNTVWFSSPEFNLPSTLPNNTDDLTATDASEYGQVGRPDMGAYEKGRGLNRRISFCSSSEVKLDIA